METIVMDLYNDQIESSRLREGPRLLDNAVTMHGNATATPTSDNTPHTSTDIFYWLRP